MIHIISRNAPLDPTSTALVRTLHLSITEEDNCKSITNLTTVLNRALNCWPDAPPELKELADMLNHGKILQDYYSQDTSKKK